MTTPASLIVHRRMENCLETVYMLRKLKGSPPYDNSARQAEFGLLRDAVNTTSVDSLFRALREINAKMLEKGKHHPLTRESTSTEDEDVLMEDVLIQEDANLMNMLSWYKFPPKASTSTLAIGASSSLEKHNKWCLQAEVDNLFNEALEEAFPGLEEKSNMSWLPRQEYNFRCDNVIDIWRKIKQGKSGSFPNIKGPKDVGEKIRETLVKQKSIKMPGPVLGRRKNLMIEGDPRVDALGFVAIKLSGKWMAEKIHKMLRDGIDTWAPEREAKSMILLYTPTWDESNLRPVDVLRRQFLIMSHMNMLEYVKYDVTTFSGNGMCLPNGDDLLKLLLKNFRIVDKDGETMVFPKDEDERTARPNICGKSRGTIYGKRDEELFGYPLEDLQALLWHGLVCKEADSVVCLAPTQQKDYIRICMGVANYAMWKGRRDFGCSSPVPTSYVGFKTCSKSLEDLLTVLYKARYPCEAGQAAKELGYTDEAVLDCALTYTFLKNHRLVDCEYKEMLDIKGNTFVYLLITKAQIHKYTKEDRKNVDKMKAERVLQDDKLLYSQGAGRELGLHLLMFTERIDYSVSSFMPHILCDYLYQLCEKYNTFSEQCIYSSYSDTDLEERKSLLLAEASAVVLEKGFNLLGITQKPMLQAVSFALALNYVAPIQIESPIQNQRIRTRFEVFSVYVHMNSDIDEVFGTIMISDEHELRPLGWEVQRSNLNGFVTLTDHNFEKIQNNGRLKIGNTKSGRSVPFASSMCVCMSLHATNKLKDDIFEICRYADDDADDDDAPPLDFSEFLKSHLQVHRGSLYCPGVDGSARLYYFLLRDAVDAVIKAELDLRFQQRVQVVIYAFYGSEDKDSGYRREDAFYSASLLDCTGASNDFKGRHLDLTRSNLAVPSNGKLVIGVTITDLDTGIDILRDKRTFPASRNGIVQEEISDTLCSLSLKLTVDWSDED